MDKQWVCARLSALYGGVKVRTGFASSPEEPQRVEYFERDDGVEIPQQDIDAAHAFVEANPPPPLPPARDVLAELDEAKATIAALLKKGAVTREEINAEKDAARA